MASLGSPLVKQMMGLIPKLQLVAAFWKYTKGTGNQEGEDADDDDDDAAGMAAYGCIRAINTLLSRCGYC